MSLPTTIVESLRRFERRRRAVTAIRTLLIGLSAAGGWVLVAAAADRGMHLSTAARVGGESVTAAILLATLAGTAGTLGRAHARVVDLAARAEAADARWGERLITVATQATLPVDRQASADLNAALAAAVTAEIAAHPPSGRVRWSSIVRPASALAGVGLMWTLLLLMPSIDARRLLGRHVLPLANLPAVTSTRIELAGHADAIPQGQPLTIVADLIGVPGPPVLHVGTTLDALRPVLMEAGVAGRFRATLLSVQSDLVYRVTAGDAATPPVRVRVLRRPGVTDVQVTLHFSDGRRVETGPQETPLRVPAGTRVAVRFRSTEPLRSAVIRSGDTTALATPQGDRRAWLAEFAASVSGAWSIDLTAETGLTGGRAGAIDVRLEQ